MEFDIYHLQAQQRLIDLLSYNESLNFIRTVSSDAVKKSPEEKSIITVVKGIANFQLGALYPSIFPESKLRERMNMCVHNEIIQVAASRIYQQRRDLFTCRRILESYFFLSFSSYIIHPVDLSNEVFHQNQFWLLMVIYLSCRRKPIFFMLYSTNIEIFQILQFSPFYKVFMHFCGVTTFKLWSTSISVSY